MAPLYRSKTVRMPMLIGRGEGVADFVCVWTATDEEFDNDMCLYISMLLQVLVSNAGRVVMMTST